jgi:hypothetical protein
MKTNIMKIFAIVALMIFVGAGVSLADGWKGDYGQRGNANGHFKPRAYQHCQHHVLPRPIYLEHRYYPVVVERHYYHEPVRYVAPAPIGFFFGMSVVDSGSAFSFGVSGR